MKRLAIALAILLSACATPQEDAASVLLNQADSKLVAEDYTGAVSTYRTFVKVNPDHPQAARARATQRALERFAATQEKLAATQATASRSQQGSDTTRRELAEKQAEADKLRAEVAKLRSDLERLRSIDLKNSRPK